MLNDYVAWFDGACGPVNPRGTAPFGAIVKKDEEGRRADDRIAFLRGYRREGAKVSETQIEIGEVESFGILAEDTNGPFRGRGSAWQCECD